MPAAAPPSNSTDPPGPGLRHAALLYRGSEHLATALTEFAADAAREGEPVLAVLPPESLERVGDSLRATGAELAVRDMRTVGNPARLLTLIDDWRRSTGARRGRVVSEPMWEDRSRAETIECLRSEAAINLAMADEPLSVLCPYDAEHLGAEILRGAEMTHPQLIDEAGVRSSGLYDDPARVAAGLPWTLSDPVDPVHEFGLSAGPGALRDALAAEPLLADLTPERRGDLVFAVNEAAVNAVAHGDGVCRTRVWREPGRVIAEVRTATSIPDLLAGRRRPAPDAPGGRGLWLMNEVCDLVELHSGAAGACLRLHMRTAA